MKNLKLGVKLIGGFVMVAALVLVVGFFGLNGANRLGANITEVADNNLPAVQSLLTIKVAMKEIDAEENNLLVKDLDAASRKASYDTFDSARKMADEARKVYETIPVDAEEKALWGKFASAWDAWWQSHQEFVRLSHEYENAVSAEAVAANTPAPAVTPAKAKASAAGATAAAADAEAIYRLALKATDVAMTNFDAAYGLLTQDIDLNIKQAAEANAAAKSTVAQVSMVAVAGMVAGFALALVLGIALALSIIRPLGKGVAFAQRVASGDFTQQLDIKQKDEVGILAQALNGMSVKLRDVVAGIQEKAEQVASSSEEISASAQKQAEGAQSQASTLEETSASIEELTASVDQVAEHAQSQASAVEQGTASMTQVQKSIEAVSANLNEIAGLAKKSAENAEEGAKAVEQVVTGINQIAESSEKIGGIVNVISDIADQTNLLALNASIEAARAGEHGRGFAVVADEVSKLADRSASSTKEIEILIKESVRSITEGVSMAQGSQKAMEQIQDASRKVKDMIGGLSDSMSQQVAAVHELAEALKNVSEMSQSISAATEEQTTNAKQVSKAVENVNEITQVAASAAEETSAATEQLSSLAQDLQREMAQFKIADEGHHASVGSNGNGHGNGNGSGNGSARRAKSDLGVLTAAGVDQRAHGSS